MTTMTGESAPGVDARAVMMMAERWWTFVLRGAAAILFGILAFIAPGASLLALVVLFGVYAIANGILHVAFASRRPAEVKRWQSLRFESIASIVAGVIALLWPGKSALALLLVIAAWAIATGIGQVMAAVRLRKHIRNEWLLALSGVLSIAFGVFMLVFPGAGALAVVFWIGAYAIVLGALFIALGVRLRSFGRSSTRVAPPGAVPVAR